MTALPGLVDSSFRAQDFACLLKALTALHQRVSDEVTCPAAKAKFALHFERLCVGAQSPRLARAQAELARLHLAEVARLCREAAELKLEHELGRGPSRARLARFREAFRDELLACAADDVRASAGMRALLSSCCALDLSAWAGARELAEAAVILHPTFASRWALARILSASGHLDEAIAWAAHVVREGVPARRRRECIERLEDWLRLSGRGSLAVRLCVCA